MHAFEVGTVGLLVTDDSDLNLDLPRDGLIEEMVEEGILSLLDLAGNTPAYPEVELNREGFRKKG